MAATDGRDIDVTEAPEDPDFSISACRTSPDRTVFTECGNSDGWIATDYTVELGR